MLGDIARNRDHTEEMPHLISERHFRSERPCFFSLGIRVDALIIQQSFAGLNDAQIFALKTLRLLGFEKIEDGFAFNLALVLATDEARAVVHSHVAQTQYVEVIDPGIFADIDTPEAYKRLLAEMPA